MDNTGCNTIQLKYKVVLRKTKIYAKVNATFRTNGTNRNNNSINYIAAPVPVLATYKTKRKVAQC